MLGVLLLSVLASIDVTGASTCPTPQAVSAGVRDLAPGFEPSRRLRAELSPTKDGLRITLRTPDGAVIAERLLAGAGTCDDLAAASAVMLLSWAQSFERTAPPPLRPGPGTVPLPTPTAPPEPPTPEPAQGRPPADATATPPSSAPMPEDDLPKTGDPSPEPLPLPGDIESPWAADLSIGLTTSIARGGVAVGGILTGGLTGRFSGVGGQLSIAALGARTVAENTTWERFALALGPHYRIDLAELAVDLHAEGLAGLLSVMSDAPAGSTLTFDPGAGVGVRVLGRGGLWADVRGALWLSSRRFQDGSAVPAAELLLSAGLTWGDP